jgi:hypothetical protein
MPNNAGMKNHSAAISRKLSDPAFTHRLLRRSFLAHVLQGVTSIALVGDLLWRDAHPPKSHYFYTDGTPPGDPSARATYRAATCRR